MSKREHRKKAWSSGRDWVKKIVRPVAKAALPKGRELQPEEWRLERAPDGALSLGQVELRALFEKWGSPLHVVDGERLDENAARFMARPPAAAGSCEAYYSYKTNPVPGVLRRLHERGMGAEVVSAYELWLALRLGVPPGRIVYNGPAKSPESVIEAVRREIGLLNVNSRAELALLAATARQLGKRPRIGIRVTLPGGWSGQFGEKVQTGAAMEAFREALAMPDLDVVALHCHLGGEIASLDRLDFLLSGVLAFADELRARLGLDLEILDLGGSLACPTVGPRQRRASRVAEALGLQLPPRPPEDVLGIDAYVARIRERVEGQFTAKGRATPRVFLEPGRAATGNTQFLLCRVVRLREPEPSGLAWAVLDAGINVADAARSESHQVFAIAPRPGSSRRPYRLVGPTCTPGDVLYGACMLPELEEGDGLAIMDAGAYFVPYSTSFSYPQPGVILIERGRVEPIRRIERFEDIVRRDILPEDPGP